MFGDKKLAKRYVKAIIAEKQLAEIEQIYAELSAVKVSLDGDLQVALNHPIIQPVQKVELMKDLSAKMKLSDESQRFLAVLVSKNRISLFDSILEDLRSILQVLECHFAFNFYLSAKGSAEWAKPF